MFRVGSWLYTRKPGANASTQSLDSLSESHDRKSDGQFMSGKQDCANYISIVEHALRGMCGR